jgi:hypothetical protein
MDVQPLHKSATLLKAQRLQCYSLSSIDCISYASNQMEHRCRQDGLAALPILLRTADL